jgi:hypothetical protein
MRQWYHDLKPGDVVRWGKNALAFVADPPMREEQINFAAWCVRPERMDTIDAWHPKAFDTVNLTLRGGMPYTSCEPFKGDKDAVWAAYCTAVLLEGSN